MAESHDNNLQTTVDGVRAIEIYYRPVKETAGNETVFYQSQIRFNAPSMGVLPPARYAAVLEASPQSVKIFELAFRQFLKALNKFSQRGVQYDWISIAMPVRYLKKPDCVQSVAAMCKSEIMKHERICFEISPSVLEETDGYAASAIKELVDNDFHVMITGIGGSCPVLKLGDFPADFFMLSPLAATVSSDNAKAFSCAKAVIDLINELGSDAIICDVVEKSQLKELKELECTYYTGKLSGTFMAERYVRARNSDSSDEPEQNLTE
ncbi:MAG: EAL domain-containing protein [Oscillospiraceae bacterium]|nr:EAL domain-containing protein [Oscillospiraceae bacterium]